MMKNEIGNMTDQIPLGKQLKYALQEKEALQEMVKESTYEYFRMLDIGMIDTGIALKRKQLLELTADLDRATEEVSELELIIFEAGAAEELVLLATEQEWMQEDSDIEFLLWEEEKRDGEENLLRQQEWMNSMDQAYEEGYFENASSKSNI